MLLLLPVSLYVSVSSHYMTVCALCRQKVCTEVVGPLLHCFKYLQHDDQR
jgi:hypothetical protein